MAVSSIEQEIILSQEAWVKLQQLIEQSKTNPPRPVKPYSDRERKRGEDLFKQCLSRSRQS